MPAIDIDCIIIAENVHLILLPLSHTGHNFGGATITFGPGTSQDQNISINILDDTIVEEDESLLISLSSLDLSVDIVNATSLLLIIDEDGE